MVPMVDSHLVIDWTQVHFCNTVMGLAAGAALATLAGIGRRLLARRRIDPRGWAISIGVMGVVFFATGLHMTRTWPLAPTGSPDNIAFGEPTLVLGILLLATSASVYFTHMGMTLNTAA